MTMLVVAGLVPGLDRIVPVAGVAPAGASVPGDRFLQVVPETQGTVVGRTLVIAAKLLRPDTQLLGIFAEAAPADLASGPITIAFELEGPGALNTDGNTPETPDVKCRINLGSDNCSVSMQSQTAGGYTVRAWIDADEKDERPGGVPCAFPNLDCGVTEADRAEGRIADVSPAPFVEADCLKLDFMGETLPNIPPLLTTAPITVSVPVLGLPLLTLGTPDNSDPDYDACTGGGPQGTATPGNAAEPDNTDVVSVAWGSGSALLDCVSARDGSEVDPRKTGVGAAGDPGQIRCQAVDANGAPLAGLNIDGENMAGANDPDDAGFASGNETVDYDSPGGGGGGGIPLPIPGIGEPAEGETAGFCTTGADGRCIGKIPQTEVQTGPANICMFIDSDNDSAFNTTTPADGSNCGEALLPDVANNTDVAQVIWETARPSGVDAKPETQNVSPVAAATVTLFAYDQFGEPATGVDLNLEWFLGSKRDGDGNSPGTPDRTCRTAATGTDPAPGSCKVTYTQGELGADLFCVYMGALADSEMVGDSTNGTCSGEGFTDATNDDGKPAPVTDKIDVAQVIWATPGPTPVSPDKSGYWFVAADGGIFAFGGAGFFGSTGNIKLNQPIVGMAATPGNDGYWLVATDGGIFAFGKAVFKGSTGNIKLNQPIVGMSETHTGNGYWMVASDGGVFAFGDAPFKGSTGNIKLNQPVVGMARTKTSQGYWFVAKDGGVFAFGDAVFKGSTGNIKLNSPIVGMAATPSGLGYWMVAADGGVFAFGDATFHGSAGSIQLTSPIVSITPTTSGRGYWLFAADGGVFGYGDATFKGSTGNIKLNSPVVGGDGF